MLENPIFRCLIGVIIGFVLSFGVWRLGRWQHGRAVRRRWRGAALLLLPLLLLGCGSQPPLTQVYAARQTYTGSLDALTTAINAGQINDKATLLKIKDIRTKIEKGLDDAEAAARAGNTVGFKFLFDQVQGWLEEYLTLQKPATRPTSLNTEIPWTPQRSSRSSLALQRLFPVWWQPMRLSAPAAPSPTSRWLVSAANRLLLRPGTTLQ